MGQYGTPVSYLPTVICSDAPLSPLTLAISPTPDPRLGCVPLYWDSFIFQVRIRPTLPRKAFLGQGRDQALAQRLAHAPPSDDLLTDPCPPVKM